MPQYAKGDYIKVEFPDDSTGVSEWMWVRVDHCDDEKRLVFGTLDSIPLNSHGGRVTLGKEMAINFERIREHKKPSGFESPN